jgi:preprotein translocase subunit SecE
VETSGSPPLSRAKSASAGITRRIRASGTTRNGYSCASIAAGAGVTPRTAKRAESSVARNRKRAKERRSRRPADGAPSDPGVATARPEHADEAPDPLEHATPDVELAAAQLALGRPDTVEESQDDADQFEIEVEAGIEADGRAGDANGADVEDHGFSGAAKLTSTDTSVPEHRARSGFRLVNFLQGSWRELQRVQWPDRRQVIQATGVVIGFVIVAGVYLGLADELSAKIVNFILK